MFEVTARLKVRHGELEGFKRQAAEMMRQTREKDTKTLRYDWFLNADGTECEVREGYVDADALLEHARHEMLPAIDFAAHAGSLGAAARKIASLAELEAALKDARKADRTSVIVVDTDPLASTEAGGHWWDVAVPEVSQREEVRTARANYETALAKQRLGD